MEAPVIAALVTAGASLLTALWTFVTGRETKARVADVEEAAKQSEQIRVKATDAGDKILDALAQVIASAETVQLILSYRKHKELSQEERNKLFEPIGKNCAAMYRVTLANAIYLDPDICDQIGNMLRPLFEGSVPFDAWQKQIEDLHNAHRRIAMAFRVAYLSGKTMKEMVTMVTTGEKE